MMNQDLQNLENQAAALDAEISADNTTQYPVMEQAAQIAAGNAQFQPLIKQALGMVVVMASQPYPFVREHFTPQQVDAQAAWIIKAADEYGIDLTRWMGEGGGRLMLWVEGFMVFGLPVMGCWAAYKGRSAAPPETPPQQEAHPTPSMEG